MANKTTHSLFKQQPVLGCLFVAGNNTWPCELRYFIYPVFLLLLSRLFFSKMRMAISKFFNLQVNAKEI